MIQAFAARCGMMSLALTAFATLLLSACAPSVPYGLPSGRSLPPPATGTQIPAEGEVIGTGDIRVALLLPLSAEGNGAQVAAEMKNAAQLALEHSGLDALELVIKDTGGTEAGAAAAAQSAARERAALVLGPLFAANVRAAGSVLAPQGITIIAFSSDRSVAAPGIYLNSYLPEGLVRRIISHAASQGLKKVVAIVPNGPAGDIDENVARATLESAGGSLLAVTRYDYDNASMQRAVQEAALAAHEADAIFLPDGGNSPSAIVAALRTLGIDLSGKRLLGTGQWASVNLSDPALQGAWFSDTDHARMNRYWMFYRQRFGREPSVTSALAYDSVILAATLARRGEAALTQASLQAPTGFAGATGAFRFLPDGTTERGYAVYEVIDGAARLISPAPTSFTGT